MRKKLLIGLVVVFAIVCFLPAASQAKDNIFVGILGPMTGPTTWILAAQCEMGPS